MTLSALAAFAANLVFPAAMAWAGLMDLTTMKIRNWLVLFLLVAYALLAPLAGFGIAMIGSSLAVALVVLLFVFAFFALGWIGGGDAKLAAVTALWLGADQTLAYVVWTALFGGVLTLGLLQFRMFALPPYFQSMEWVARLQASGGGVPYGVAMASAALVVFPDTAWMAALA